MTADSLSEDKFDRMLAHALRQHLEPVSAGFRGMVLDQIKQVEEQRLLARVILQERLALAACITLIGAVIVGAAVFPDAVAAALRGFSAALVGRGEALTDRIPQTVRAVGGEWQLYTVLAFVSGFAIYSLVELLVGDRLRIA